MDKTGYRLPLVLGRDQGRARRYSIPGSASYHHPQAPDAGLCRQSAYGCQMAKDFAGFVPIIEMGQEYLSHDRRVSFRLDRKLKLTDIKAD